MAAPVHNCLRAPPGVFAFASKHACDKAKAKKQMLGICGMAKEWLLQFCEL